jgi:hypothetical protein
MIYISYFAKVARHPLVLSGTVRPMSIARHAPAGWPEDDAVPSLFPWPFMIDQYKSGNLTAAGYELRYRECVLQNVSAKWIAERYANCVLCCYEAPEAFCHRHIVRQWLAEHYWLNVQELTFDGDAPPVPAPAVVKPERKETVEQLSLF